jgi:predicted aconitase with swiveling domain
MPAAPITTSSITGEALCSNIGISFWGGIDPLDGKVIDQTHPLHGRCIKDKILCIPSGRGSCTGSQVLLELILNGNAPRAIILRDVDSILCTGAVIAEEFFHDENDVSIPIICAVGQDNFLQLLQENNDADMITIESQEDNTNIFIGNRNGSKKIVSRNLLALNTHSLDGCNTDKDGIKSQAESLALRVVQRIACISGATELIPITCAHIDAVTYIGRGGLQFAQKLAKLGGKVKVPTTLNSQSTDRRRWKQLGVDETLATNANSVGDAYLELGCEMSVSIGSYFIDSCTFSSSCVPFLL